MDGKEFCRGGEESDRWGEGEGKVPVVVGGTGHYVYGLLVKEGFAGEWWAG